MDFVVNGIELRYGDYIFIEEIESTGLYLIELRNTTELNRIIPISKDKGLEDSQAIVDSFGIKVDGNT